MEIEDVLQDIEGIKFIYFSERDVVRHRLVQEIVKAYERHEKRSSDNPKAPEGISPLRRYILLAVLSSASAAVIQNRLGLEPLLGAFLVACLLLYVHYRDIQRYKPIYMKKFNMLVLLGLMIVGTLLAGRVFHYVLLNLSKGLGFLSLEGVAYGMPVPAGAMLVTLLFDFHTAIVFSFVVSILTGVWLQDALYPIFAYVGSLRGAAIGAAVGALGGYAWSQRMENQRRQVEAATQGTGAQVEKTPDNRIRVVVPDNISFDSGRADIKPGFRSMLDQFAQSLTQNPQTTVQIIGHTDSTGDDAFNLNLSRERALATRDYLATRGVSLNRIAVDGRGEREPVATNDSDAGRARNRRVEIFLQESAA